MEKGWTSVFCSSDEYLVAIAKDLLENSGIESVVINRKDSAYVILGEAELYVTDQNEIQAREILKQLHKG